MIRQITLSYSHLICEAALLRILSEIYLRRVYISMSNLLKWRLFYAGPALTEVLPSFVGRLADCPGK